MWRARWRLRARMAFFGGLAVGAAAGEVGVGGRVEAGLGKRDHVQRGVELAVAGAVEAVAALSA